MNVQLLARYLAGDHTVKEEKKVRRWLQADIENQKLMEDYKRIWNASDGSFEEDLENYFDPLEGWSNLNKRIIQEKDEGLARELSIAHLNGNYSAKTQNRSIQLVRMAAIILVASLIGVFSYQYLYHEPTTVEPALREISMDRGQRGNIMLSDGTRVTLNAESKITLPNVFRSDKREVTLEGEAYFEVARNPDRPFIIHTDNAVVEVLGTTFDVRSYADENVQVVVKEGRVSFESKKKDSHSKVFLNAGEMGKLPSPDSEIQKKSVEDLDLFLSWKNGYLKFKNKRMEDVAHDLERRYDIDIAFADESLKDLKITAELKGRTIKHNMDVIATSLNMEYKMNQHVVTFYKEMDKKTESS